MRLHLEDTYLYKFHMLTMGLDKLFDDALRKHAGIGLSHFLILLAIRQHKTISPNDIATFLSISPAAISRQIKGANKLGWLEMKGSESDKRGQQILLSRDGEKVIKKGLRCLETHVFSIFLGSNRQADLMSHIDLLLANMKGEQL